MTIEPVTVAGKQAYSINGTTLCVVTLSRPQGAAVTMYGCLAVAHQIDANGEVQSGPEGRHTEAVLKSALIADPAAVAAEVAARATTAAIEALANEIAVRAANQAVGI
ncbi:hypothetical protein LJR143_002178 [Pseudoxanthomonas sp. LjRoot143]|uniref:hypothetical protein n=1 Tax=Pseudoxanthomonas sp. LjRoot143 TaxID=3342266 RepID=UPI003ECD3CDA